MRHFRRNKRKITTITDKGGPDIVTIKAHEQITVDEKTSDAKEGRSAKSKAAAPGGKYRAPKRTGGILSNVIFFLGMIALVGGSILFALNGSPDKSIFGYRFYSIKTGSMTPGAYSEEKGLTGGFRAGDMIIVKLCDPAEIKVGDIITFVPGSDSTAYLTHRVAEIKTALAGSEGLFFVTRGDANNADDPPISANMLIGKKVLSIPHMGAAVSYVKQHIVISFVMIISVFLLLLTLNMFFKKAEAEQAPHRTH